MNFFAKLLIVALIAVAFAPETKAQPSGIQMLPPIDFSDQPCSAETGGFLQWDGTTPIKCVPNFIGDSNGNVSIGGNVAARGSVQIGATHAACTPSLAGSVSFDLATRHFEGCDGASWTPLGNSPDFTKLYIQYGGHFTGGSGTKSVFCPNGDLRISCGFYSGGENDSGDYNSNPITPEPPNGCSQTSGVGLDPWDVLAYCAPPI